MIDLRKPLRGTIGVPAGEVVFTRSPSGRILAEVGEYWRVLLDSENEAANYFENIPETRKPREWQSFLNPFTTADNDYVVRFKEPLRVIEWPKDAPLPDWPEGYP